MLSAKLLLVYLLHSTNITGIDVDTSKIDLDQAYCLAQNVFYESRNEDIQGQWRLNHWRVDEQQLLASG